VDEACNQMSVIGMMYWSSVSLIKESVCEGADMGFFPFWAWRCNCQEYCNWPGSQEDNANELLLNVLAKQTATDCANWEMMWTGYSWYC
jgi:hypothetical protein